MGQKKRQPSGSRLWALAKKQHGVVARSQLLSLGFSSDSINHRLAKGRLHRVFRGVYAIGRPELSRHGRWMAAVLNCGSDAVLSYETAAALWEIRPKRRGDIAVSVPACGGRRQRAGIRLHRRALSADDLTQHYGIPVTTPARTLLDLATRLSHRELEAAVNEADRRDLIDPEELRCALDRRFGGPGVVPLPRLPDPRPSPPPAPELERPPPPIARRAGLGSPETGR